MSSEDLAEFCCRLPKIELHAHLNGSLSKETLVKLYKLNYASIPEQLKMISIDNLKNISDVSQIFSLAHSLTTTADSVYMAAYETIKEFNDDRVIYLELRSTPRSGKNMSKEEYIKSIIKAIETCRSDGLAILVKLLISINRGQDLEAAEENINLAIKMKLLYPNVVGVDLSGDPTKGKTFLDSLNRARLSGLKIAVHCAEVFNETESMDILRLKPERLGHCTCMHPKTNGTELLFQALIDSQIPIGM